MLYAFGGTDTRHILFIGAFIADKQQNECRIILIALFKLFSYPLLYRNKLYDPAAVADSFT